MNRLERAARTRIKQCHERMSTTMEKVRAGVPLAAEYNSTRALARLQATTGLTRDAAIAARAAMIDERPADAADGRERIWGPTIDFVGVAFLERGWCSAQAVGRVAYRDGRPQGSGFLVAPGLFLTNNHVIGTREQSAQFAAEFDYQIDCAGNQCPVSRFELDAQKFFITDDTDDLDYTLIAVGRRLSGPRTLDEFGYCPLSDAGDKHSLGEVANVVQHPDGRYKEVVLRENTFVSRLQNVLHYVADTEPGSSGSPVFNNEWRAVALHHWGGPWRQQRDAQGRWLPREVNEGIRISAIVNELHERMGELTADQRGILNKALHLGESSRGVPAPPSPGPDDSIPHVRLREDGTAAWRIPIEISVGIPSLQVPSVAPHEPTPQTMVSNGHPERFRRELDRNYDNRKGYKPRFIWGHQIDLPGLSGERRQRAARNLQAEPGDDPLEFPYQNFSVVMDGERRLPMLTACNIDGKRSNNVNRTTGRVSRAEAAERLEESGPEGREKWYKDPRIDADLCADDTLYLNQTVAPGRNRTGRIFHRGHMVRRLDPAWGTDRNTLRAEADTFHFTNCTPQVGFFNTRTSLWQGIENYVLDNARAEDKRVCVFTGPVLDDANDPPWREELFPRFRVPLMFWKVVVWKDESGLAAVGMVADQGPVLSALPEGADAEAFLDTSKVEDFVMTIPEVEKLTGLDFGDEVRTADLYEEGGPESLGSRGRKRVTRYEDIVLIRASRTMLSEGSKRVKSRRRRATKVAG